MLRVGSVPYLVGRPLDLGLLEEPDIDLKYAVPAKLVEELRDGSIDVALVSSIELFRQPGYTYLAGPAVAGAGVVSSVQVFLKRPVEEVRTVALDPSSRTAATLSQIVWPGQRAEHPEFVEVGRGGDPRVASADAWLRIGDVALRETHESDPPAAFNPSGTWCEATGLPFVFALWIARPGVDLAPWTGAFVRAYAYGQERLETLAVEAARQWNLPEAVTRHYLMEECLYDPVPDIERSLFTFRDGAAPLGLAQGHLSPVGVPVEATRDADGKR